MVPGRSNGCAATSAPAVLLKARAASGYSRWVCTLGRPLVAVASRCDERGDCAPRGRLPRRQDGRRRTGPNIGGHDSRSAIPNPDWEHSAAPSGFRGYQRRHDTL